MYIKNVDGKPIFATHLIQCTIDKKHKFPFQIEEEGILCYSKEETSNAIKKLKELNIEYNISILQNTKQTTLDDSIEFQNRTEIIDYLNDSKIPKHKKEYELEKKVEVLEQQVKLLMDKLNIKH